MACKYCYTGSAFKKYPNITEINERFRLALPMLFHFIEQVVSYNNNKPTRVILHGGEPLLISADNWESLLNRHIRDIALPVKWGVQTNGTLLSEEFISVFREFNVEVGVSLDGPASLNDQTRILKSGERSFFTVFKSIHKLKNAGLKFGVLVTLNKTNINKIEGIYKFFKKENISFSVRPIFQTKHHLQKKFLITPSEYGIAICKLFNLWFDDIEVDTSLIEEFTNMVAYFIHPIEGLVSCNFTKNCSEHFLCIDLNGKVYPCNRFYGEDAFLYGNIKDEDLVRLLNKSSRRCLSNRYKKISEYDCSECEIYGFCYGGCPANAYYFRGNYLRKDYYCGAYKMIFKHAYGKIKSSIPGLGHR